MSVTSLSAETGPPVNGGVAPLRQFPVFCHLSDDILMTLAARMEERSFEEGGVVFTAGQYEAEDIYCCLEGSARLILTGPDGTIRRRAIEAGTAVGLDCVLAGAPETALSLGLEATSDARFLLIHADAVREAVSASHATCLMLLREIARERLQDHGIGVNGARGAMAKLCQVLLSLAERAEGQAGAIDAHWNITAMPRHRELAALAGTEEKIAAEGIARLIGMGVLKRAYPGMLITDHTALMDMAG